MTQSEPKVRQINKLLIANRGEIAARIIRSAKRMGIRTLAINPGSDAELLADESVTLPGEYASDIFLNAVALIELAKRKGADAIHPGYGYLSENGEFARRVQEAGILFIGPGPDAILQMGNKKTARHIAENLGIPVAKAIYGSLETLMEKGQNMTFPVLVKAAAGGGGKGMLPVFHPHELHEKLNQASREALNYFGDGSVYLEQFIENPRHIEIQILGDQHGHLIHLFERECSIQRRYQKIIEESPSPFVDDTLRRKLTHDALLIAEAIHYFSAGTVEFLVDANGQHYFLEMNTRIQVEHPVTEMVTGVDLVEEQLKIAMGYPLLLRQEAVQQTGHALECRIYAEDAESDFNPAPGKVHRVQWPPLELARTDTWFNHPTEISSDFDPMVAKVITHAPTRLEAISKARAALRATRLTGLTTNIHYLESILEEQDFIQGNTHTGYCKNHNLTPVQVPDLGILASAFLIWQLSDRQKGQSPWLQMGYWRMANEAAAMVYDQKVNLTWTSTLRKDVINLVINNNPEKILADIRFADTDLQFSWQGKYHSFGWCLADDGRLILENQHKAHFITPCSLPVVESAVKPEISSDTPGHHIRLQAPIPGKASGILIKEGDLIKKGDRLMTLVAMKMENHLQASEDGVVETIHIQSGQQVKARDLLISIRT